MMNIYTKSLALRTKPEVADANLEGVAQRVAAKAEDVLAAAAIREFGPYLVAERFADETAISCGARLARYASSLRFRSYWHSDLADHWHDPVRVRFVGKKITTAGVGEVEPPAPIGVPDMGHRVPGDLVPGQLGDGNVTEVPRGRQLTSEVTPLILQANTPDKVSEGIQKRITEKQIKPELTRDDIKAIRSHVSYFKRKVFTVKAIEHAMHKTPLFEEMRSKKWTKERFYEALKQSLAHPDDAFNLKVQVKNEPLPAGKPPRLIVADGDPGQVMALACLYIMEDVLFHHFEKRTIKHTNKLQAIKRVCNALDLRNASIVEADGSAWDTCCSAKVRALIENPIIQHIVTTMQSLGWEDLGFEEVHQNTNSQKKLKLSFKTRTYNYKFIIDAIRRSGHRGTSVLNWLVNHVLTMSSLNPEADTRLYTDSGRKFIDRWGKERRAAFAHEGDDTLYSTSPPLKPEQVDEIISFWKRCGFNMKLFVRDKVAEFTGWKIPIINGRLQTNEAVPDFLRNFTNGAISVSREAIDGDWQRVAASKFASYAHSFQHLPTVGEVFRRWADEYGFDGTFLDEDKLRLGYSRDDAIVTPMPDTNQVSEDVIMKHLLGDDGEKFLNLIPAQAKEGDMEWIAGFKYLE
jgi:hypothetical protein